MGIWDRAKSMLGGDSGLSAKTFASATTLNVPDDITIMQLTGTATITSLTTSPYCRGRFVWFYQSDTGTTTFTNTPGATTAGQMDLGALDNSNVVVGPTDWLHLYVRMDGTWIRVTQNTNN